MSDYTISRRADCSDYMAGYEGFGEMLAYTDSLGAEQVALTWRRMPPGTGGRGSYGHRHLTQEEIYLVTSGTVTFKIGDDVFEAGTGTAVRIAPDALRSVHNDGDDDAEIVLCSVRVDDLGPEVVTEDGFWDD
ncbi:MAG TPA: cupin domain-containing protein [Solirubrobacterales bacterium]|nr:cupin domain-containing protein [Solirubrobacterales bacterium]